MMAGRALFDERFFERKMGMDEEKSELDLEWERRILCSDGNCIGIIGPDGKCKECGKPYEGDLPDPVSLPESDSGKSTGSDVDSGTEAGDTEGADPDDTGDISDDFDGEWEKRQLCSDGNCIGVIGPDGKCKECGKVFEG